MKRINTTRFSQAFTLLEVLIATSIFAMVMIMTTGVIAQSTGYQTKTKAMNDTSEEAGRISDAIARDLKTAEGAITIFNSLGPVTVGRSFKNGVALIDGVSGAFVGATSPMPYPTGSTSMNITNYPAGSLIINTKDSIKVYTTKADIISGQNTVYAKTYVKANTGSGSLIDGGWLLGTTLYLKSDTMGSLITAITSNQANKISTTNPDNALDTAVAFSGYTVNDDPLSTVKAQSYITYYVHSLTKDFATLPPTSRSETYLRSMVTVRNYSNK